MLAGLPNILMFPCSASYSFDDSCVVQNMPLVPQFRSLFLQFMIIFLSDLTLCEFSTCIIIIIIIILVL